MKKRSKQIANLLKLGVFLFGFSLLLWNCEKEQEEFFNPNKQKLTIQAVPIEKAQEIFNTFESKNSSSKEQSSKNSTLQITPNWNSYSQQTLSFEKASLAKVEAKINVNVSLQTGLIFVKVNNVFVKAIESSDVKEFYDDGKIKEGKVYFHSFKGHYLDGYRIKEGKVVKKLVVKKHVAKASILSLHFLFQECDESLDPTNEFCDNELDEVEITGVGGSGSDTNDDYYYLFLGDQDYGRYNGDGSGGEDNSWDDSDSGAGNTTPCLGKIKNPVTGACECPDGKIEDVNGNCVENPCKYIKLQIQNPNYTTQVNELEGKTGERKETGYKQNKDGTQVALTDTNNGHSLNIPVDRNTVGFMHTHINDYNTGRVDTKTGEDIIDKPIKIFSPADVIAFLQIVKFSKYNGVPTHLVYGTMISNTGSYTLRFTGNIDAVTGLKSASAYDADYKLYIKDKGKEKGFLHFLKDFIQINGINLYRIRDNGDIEEKTLNSNGKVDTNDCE